MINLEVPSIEKKFELFIPNDLMIESLVPMITNSLNNITYEKYVSSGEEVLCLKEKNILLSKRHNISEYCINNGDTLFLI